MALVIELHPTKIQRTSKIYIIAFTVTKYLFVNISQKRFF